MGTKNTSKELGRSVKYSEEVFLEAISDLAEDDSDLIASAPNIHARLIETDKEISKRAVYNRLQDMRERGLVERKEISKKFYRWVITDEGEEFLEEARRNEEENDEGGETSD
jgi:Fe2+ or Zn2+ uptake regulation protein